MVDQEVSLLIQLGLTRRQAEVYLAIVRLKLPTATRISEALKIARAEVYRALPELQTRGLIQKAIGVPNVFKAVPLKEAVKILLEHLEQNQREIRAKVEQCIKSLKTYTQEENKIPKTTQYWLATGLKPATRQYLKDLQEIQKSKDCVLKWEVILFMVNRDSEYLKKALERGVKIRYISAIPEGEKMPQTIQSLTEKGSFEVRSASAIPKASIDIFDGKILHIITVSATQQREIEVLRSDNPDLIDLLQDYFELKWQTAKAPT